MKRIISILSVLAALVLLCSCAVIKVPYNHQNNINTNYNNISSLAYRYWLTSDSYCYSDIPFMSSGFYLVTGGKHTRIGDSLSFSSSIQQYGDTVYTLRETEDLDKYRATYTLSAYNVNTEITKRVFSVVNCYDFLVIDDAVYYLTFDHENENEDYTYSLYKYTKAGGHELIRASVASFGAVGDKVYYITADSDVYTVYEYDGDDNTSLLRGEFSLPMLDYGGNVSFIAASYTSERVLICADSHKLKGVNSDVSYVYNYCFADGTMTMKKIDMCADTFIAYDKYSFFSAYTFDDDDENNYVFRYDNSTNEYELIAKGENLYPTLFVASDEGVYVQSENTLFYYEPNTPPKTVFKSILSFDF